MEINEERLLGINNYYSEETKKKQIVIGNSLTKGLSHIDYWEEVLNGECKNTSPFSIAIDGTIYKHFDPKFYSDFLGIDGANEQIIGITLENEGHLWYDSENKQYFNWMGDIYSRKDKVVNVKWRGRETWAPYSTKQINSLSKLCRQLCKDYGIEQVAIDTNTHTHSVEKIDGIVYRSNYSKYSFDVSPAFDIKSFKNKIEKK